MVKMVHGKRGGGGGGISAVLLETFSGEEGGELMFGYFARGYAVRRSTSSSRRACGGDWRMWDGWRSSAGKGATELDVVDDVTAFIAYCCVVRGNRYGTTTGKQRLGMTLLLGLFRVKAARKGIQRARVGTGS